MFAFDKVETSSLDPEILVLATPTKTFVEVKDPRSTRMVSQFMQVYETDTIDEPPVRIKVVSQAQLAFLLYDEFVVPLEVLAQHPKVGWARARIALKALSRSLVDAVDTHGMDTEPCSTYTRFIAKFKAAVNRMPEGLLPRLRLDELEVQANVAYVDGLESFKYMAWLEELSLSRLRLSSGKIEGWGLMLFSMEETSDATMRYAPESAFVSVGSQWYMRIVTDSYAGVVPALRKEIFGVQAIEAIRRGMRWMGSYSFSADSIVREVEFTKLVALGSPSSSVVESTMRFAMYSIIQGIEGLVSLRKLMGKTRDSETLFGYVKRLKLTLVSSMDAWDMAMLMAVEGEVSLRIRFCELEENESMSDSHKVDYLISLRTVASQSVDKSTVISARRHGEAEIEETKGTLSAADLYEYHTSEAFERANQELSKLLDNVNVTKSMVLRKVFKLGQWQLTQFMVGKLQLSGHKLYASLSSYRCEWGWNDLATVDSEIGSILGQELMRSEIDQGKVHKDHLGVSLAKKGLVRAIVSGQLATLNFEDAFLIQYFKSRSNVTMSKTPENERFTSYQMLDLLSTKVGPIFELFGCGPPTQESSFASLMEACKVMSRDITGLPEKKKKALIFGEFGMRSIVMEALANAGARFRQMFYNKDKSCVLPLAFITGAKADHAFLHRLQVQQTATAEQRRRSMIFDADSDEDTTVADFTTLKKEYQSTRGVCSFERLL